MGPDVVPGATFPNYEFTAHTRKLVSRGVDVIEPFHFGSKGQTPGLHLGWADCSSFVSFNDPDGNGWLIQEVKKRAPEACLRRR